MFKKYLARKAHRAALAEWNNRHSTPSASRVARQERAKELAGYAYPKPVAVRALP